MKKKLVVIPLSSEGTETATAIPDSVGDYVEGQTSITFNQLVKLCAYGQNLSEKDVRLTLKEMTPEERYDYLTEEIGYYTLDELAIVDPKNLPLFTKWSNKALDHGCDSTLYEACENYNEKVRLKSKKIIKFFNDNVITRVCYE